MIKKLTKHGNSLALVIDRGILKLLEIDEATPLSVTTDGRNLFIAPVGDAKRQKRFREALGKINVRHGRTRKR